MAAPRDTPFACQCGAVTGVIRGASPARGTHVGCYCADCRAADIYAGQADPAPDPVGLYQTTPDAVRFDRGLEHVQAFSFGKKNLLRWYAGCCGVTLANTLRTPKFAFVGFRTDRLQDTDAIGPRRVEAFIPQPGGGVKHKRIARAVWNMMSRAAVARLSGQWKETPFFDTGTSRPVREIHVVDAQTRKDIKRAF